MVNITSKSPELLQAQAASFASETLTDARDRTHVLTHVGAIVLSGEAVATRVRGYAEYTVDDAGTAVEAAGSIKEVADIDDMTNYLRSVGGREHVGIQQREQMIGAYADFADEVDNVRRATASTKPFRFHEERLGEGLHAQVMRLHHDAADYAVRFIKDGRSHSIVDHYISGGALGRGLPHLEQIVAASYEDGVTVAELAPGTHSGELSIDTLNRVTETQIGELAETVIMATQRGIVFDPNMSNILYDPEAGFTILDYRRQSDAASVTNGDVMGAVNQFADVVAELGSYENLARKTDKTFYAKERLRCMANRRLIEYYRAAADRELAGTYDDTLADDMNFQIFTLDQKIRDYADSEWIRQHAGDDQPTDHEFTAPYEV